MTTDRAEFRKKALPCPVCGGPRLHFGGNPEEGVWIEHLCEANVAYTSQVAKTFEEAYDSEWEPFYEFPDLISAMHPVGGPSTPESV